MKQILSLAKAYHPHLGGVETIVRAIGEGAREKGYATRVLCFGKGPKEEEIAGVRVHRISATLSLGSAPLSPEYFKEFRHLALQADLVHIHSPNPAGELAWLSAPPELRKNLPSLCTYQGDPVRPRLLAPAYLGILRRFLAACSAIAVSSPPLLASSKALIRERSRCRIIPLGVRTERFRPPLQRDSIETSQETDPTSGLSSPLGLFVGRLVYYKGVEVLLEALARVPSLSLLLVGTGPLEKKLERQARKLGISSRVRFIPPVEDTLYPALFSRADFFVLPSVSPSEAFGLSLAEALASGLPAISTELGTGTSYVNRHGETGLVVPPRDPAALAEAMRNLCDFPGKAHSMGEKGALRAQNLFDERDMVARYCGLYGELLAGKN